jgi:hypothetical protein
MLKSVLTSELKSHFPNIDFESCGEDFKSSDKDDVIATFLPVHQSWKPVVICDDGDEVTVSFGDFTHKHYGYYGEKTDPEVKALSVAADVIEDKLEFFKFGGGGGCLTSGTQGKFSKILFGRNGVVWSGSIGA